MIKFLQKVDKRNVLEMQRFVNNHAFYERNQDASVYCCDVKIPHLFLEKDEQDALRYLRADSFDFFQRYGRPIFIEFSKKHAGCSMEFAGRNDGHIVLVGLATEDEVHEYVDDSLMKAKLVRHVRILQDFDDTVDMFLHAALRYCQKAGIFKYLREGGWKHIGMPKPVYDRSMHRNAKGHRLFYRRKEGS